MTTIKDISSREILNSKGNPTIETMVTLNNGITTIASSPSGTSVSSFEALEIPIHKALEIVDALIKPALVGKNPENQKEIDTSMLSLDTTENKARIGGNTMISVSMAVAKAAALNSRQPLYSYIAFLCNQTKQKVSMPTPIFNSINGGKHGSGTLDFQEFILVPAKTKTYSEALHMGVSLYQKLKKILTTHGQSTLVGYEGGFEPTLKNNHDAIDLLVQTIHETHLTLGKDVSLGIDAAANSFFTNNSYCIKDKSTSLSAPELILYYQELAKKFHMTYLEDILYENSWSDWTHATTVLQDTAMVVGDDLVATNPARLQTAIETKAITAVIIKPNQIGTITETLSVVKAAKEAGLTIIVSHRSGETNDDFIADFGVGIGADYVKFGAPVRGERVAKYNRLRMIEEEIHTY